MANAAQPIADAHCHLLVATVRPDGPPPANFPGLCVFRWFEVAAEDCSAFRDLSAAAWPNVEANFELQIHGFWRSLETSQPSSWTLLHTRYVDFSVWEASRWWRQLVDDAPMFSERLKARNKVIRDTIAFLLIELASAFKSPLTPAARANRGRGRRELPRCRPPAAAGARLVPRSGRWL